MTRFCTDSTTVSDLDPTVPLALRYVDGAFAETEAAVRARCPKARQATVTVTGRDLSANMIDCELGDVDPNGAARWAAAKRAADKGFPTIYCEDSQHPQVIAACKQRGMTLHTHYKLFIANYDGDPTIPAYAVGKQYRSPDGTGAGHIDAHRDVSVVRDYWRGVDPRHRRLLGVRVSRIKNLLAAITAWVKKHPAKAKHEIVVFAGLLAAQPAVHALIHGQKTTAAAVIAAVGAAVLAAAKKFSA